MSNQLVRPTPVEEDVDDGNAEICLDSAVQGHGEAETLTTHCNQVFGSGEQRTRALNRDHDILIIRKSDLVKLPVTPTRFHSENGVEETKDRTSSSSLPSCTREYRAAILPPSSRTKERLREPKSMRLMFWKEKHEGLHVGDRGCVNGAARRRASGNPDKTEHPEDDGVR